jgi:hypothetical protein
LVADHHEGREAEALTALHNLRDAIDVNELVNEFATLSAIATTVAAAITTAALAAAATAAALFLFSFLTGHRKIPLSLLAS